MRKQEVNHARAPFMSFITDEIRTPLAVINASIEEILVSGDGNEATKQRLQIIKNHTLQLADLCNALPEADETDMTDYSMGVSPEDNRFIEAMKTCIENNLTNSHLNVRLIAMEMKMSITSLYRKVKSLTDFSPVDFIRMMRLQKATQLMQNGEKRLKEIAYHVGFSSPAYFSTSFQKQYGKSPSAFIKDL